MGGGSVISSFSTRCDDWFWRLYERAPQPGLDLIGSAFRYSLPLVRQSVPVTVYRGSTPPRGQRGMVVTAGVNPWLGDLARRFFANEPTATTEMHCPVWALPLALRRYEGSADLIAARVDRLTSRILFGAGYLAVPEWVDTYIPVPPDPSILFRNESVRTDLRRIRKSGITVRVSHHMEDFNRFYHGFHAPFVNRRHGELAHLRNIYRLRRMFGRGGLLWIERNGEPVAGLVFERQPGRFRMIVVGMVGEDKRLMGEGVPSAAYYFSILQARHEGRGIVDLGGVRPVLNDGVLRFKRKWGARLADKRDIYHDYMVHLKEDRPAVIDFLSHTPIIYQDRLGLSAIAALPTARPRDNPPLGYGVTPGLRRLTVLNAAGAGDALAGCVPEGAELILR
jgi:hypothetical protein